MPSPYYDLDTVRRSVQRGDHRTVVGGLWEEVGELVFLYLVRSGLRPEMRLLDIGCGCLRVGVHLVDFLYPAHYFGIDVSEDLLRAGYETELARAGLQSKLPRGHLLCDARFRFDRLPWERPFQVALAQSLFTHLPLNQIRLCLARLAPVLEPGGVLYATIFHCSSADDWMYPITHYPGAIKSYWDQDPYHYRLTDLDSVARDLPFSLELDTEWEHPRGQRMVALTRQ